VVGVYECVDVGVVFVGDVLDGVVGLYCVGGLVGGVGFE